MPLQVGADCPLLHILAYHACLGFASGKIYSRRFGGPTRRAEFVPKLAYASVCAQGILTFLNNILRGRKANWLARVKEELLALGVVSLVLLFVEVRWCFPWGQGTNGSRTAAGGSLGLRRGRAREGFNQAV